MKMVYGHRPESDGYRTRLKHPSRPPFRVIPGIRRSPLIALALLILGCGSNNVEAQILEYSILRQGTPIGAMSVHQVKHHVHVEYSYSDNGRGPTLSTDITLTGRGIPEAVVVSGQNPLRVSISEKLTAQDGRLHWTSDIDAGDGAVDHFYVTLNETPENVALLAQALLTAPGRTLPLLPSGQATVMQSEDREFTVEGTKKSAHFILLGGLTFGPTGIWLDDAGHLFFAGSNSAVIAKGWESAVGDIQLAEKEILRKYFESLSARLSPRSTSQVLISNVIVFDTVTKSTKRGMSVLIDGNRIAAVGDERQIRVPEHVSRIDGKGGTLLPGLWDMHVHLQSDLDGFLDLGAGVTSVRDMGNPMDEVTDWRLRFSTGELIGPRVMLAGLIDGRGPKSNASAIKVSTPEELSRAITMLADNGYNELKIYSSVDPALIPQAVAQAHARGLRVGGHIPAGMRLDDAVKAGFDDVSHFNFFLLNFLGEDAKTKTNSLDRMLIPARSSTSIDIHSPAVANTIAEMRRRNVTFDATLIVLEDLFTGKPGEFSHYLEPYGTRLPTIIARSEKTGGLASNESERSAFSASYRRALELLKEVHDGGVNIVPGTDGRAGLMLPHELEIYVQAGIAPADVLQMATLQSARMMRRDSELGSIETGKLADLILVDGDPSQDISTIRRVKLTIKDGHVFQSNALLEAAGLQPDTTSKPLEIR